jgi:hypothetical protein
MRKKPKKTYQPPVPAPVAEENATPATPRPPRPKRVREAPLSAKELSRAAKKATRARWLSTSS